MLVSPVSYFGPPDRHGERRTAQRPQGPAPAVMPTPCTVPHGGAEPLVHAQGVRDPGPGHQQQEQEQRDDQAGTQGVAEVGQQEAAEQRQRDPFPHGGPQPGAHVQLGFDPPWQPTPVHPARGIAALWSEPAGHTPDALVRLLGRGRATVLAALTDPTTTTALARRPDLAPSSVSVHLTTLRDAGLLVARRYGHQVLYERTPLGMAPASGGG